MTGVFNTLQTFLYQVVLLYEAKLSGIHFSQSSNLYTFFGSFLAGCRKFQGISSIKFKQTMLDY